MRSRRKSSPGPGLGAEWVVGAKREGPWIVTCPWRLSQLDRPNREQDKSRCYSTMAASCKAGRVKKLEDWSPDQQSGDSLECISLLQCRLSNAIGTLLAVPRLRPLRTRPTVGWRPGTALQGKSPTCSSQSVHSPCARPSPARSLFAFLTLDPLFFTISISSGVPDFTFALSIARSFWSPSPLSLLPLSSFLLPLRPSSPLSLPPKESCITPSVVRAQKSATTTARSPWYHDTIRIHSQTARPRRLVSVSNSSTVTPVASPWSARSLQLLCWQPLRCSPRPPSPPLPLAAPTTLVRLIRLAALVRLPRFVPLRHSVAANT